MKNIRVVRRATSVKLASLAFFIGTLVLFLPLISAAGQAFTAYTENFLGYGYFSSTVRLSQSKCVDVEYDPNLHTALSQESSVINELTTSRQSRDAWDFSAGIQAKGLGWGASANGSASEVRSSSTFEKTYIAQGFVRYAPIPATFKLSRQGNKFASDPRKFAIACGDSFLANLVKGGVLTAVAVVRTTNNSTAATRFATASANYMGVSAYANFAKAVSSVEMSNMSFQKVFQRGVREGNIYSSTDIQQYATRWRDSLTTEKVLLSVGSETADYGSVSRSPVASPVTLQQLQDVEIYFRDQIDSVDALLIETQARLRYYPRSLVASRKAVDSVARQLTLVRTQLQRSMEVCFGRPDQVSCRNTRAKTRLPELPYRIPDCLLDLEGTGDILNQLPNCRADADPQVTPVLVEILRIKHAEHPTARRFAASRYVDGLIESAIGPKGDGALMVTFGEGRATLASALLQNVLDLPYDYPSDGPCPQAQVCHRGSNDKYYALGALAQFARARCLTDAEIVRLKSIVTTAEVAEPFRASYVDINAQLSHWSAKPPCTMWCLARRPSAAFS